MALHSTRWLALSYFTYFFSYGIFLPFWSVWLKGLGLRRKPSVFCWAWVWSRVFSVVCSLRLA